MTFFSRAAADELLAAVRSESLRQDMRKMTNRRHNPVLKNGEPDVDAYVHFVMEFNAFIGHRPKPFRRIIDSDMRL
jgi:hypothetical protein